MTRANNFICNNPVSFATQTICHCTQCLATARDLSPNHPAIHVVLASLEGLCRTPFNADDVNAILQGIDIHMLRHYLAEAEHADEHFHAQQILSASNDDFNLHARVQGVYARMVKSELDMAAGHMGALPERCVFVGCGALPLTAVYINHFSGMKVTAIDCHEPCAAIGLQVIEKIGASDVDIVVSTGETFDYTAYGLVYVASMVPNKIEVMRQIGATNPNALVITRGGAGLRQLFYAGIDRETFLAEGWECLAIAPPPEGVKNTSYLFRLRRAT
jgi:hypothetical protein